MISAIMPTMMTKNTDFAVPSSRLGAIAILLSGMLGLVLAMGIGRFTYTTILPLMQRDLGLTYAMGGWLAGVNLVGYLAGAAWAFFAPRAAHSHKVALAMILTSLFGSYAMGLNENVMWWSLVRLAAGLASGMLFVYVSSEATARLIRRGRGNWAGMIYSGVGIGIVLTGVFTPLFDGFAAAPDGWRNSWIGFGVLATVLTIIAIALMLPSHKAATAISLPTPPPLPWPRLYLITAAYFFEALGYIVSATFLVTIITSLPAVAHLAPWVWILVGASVIPSAFLWTWLGRQIGVKWALTTAYALQGAGMLVCMHASTQLEVVFVAVSFGGTFMGIVALMMAEGGRRSPPNSRRITALLTAVYAVGQVIAPVVAGWIADATQSFAIPMALAAGCIVVGIVLVLIDSAYTTPFPETGD